MGSEALESVLCPGGSEKAGGGGWGESRAGGADGDERGFLVPFTSKEPASPAASTAVSSSHQLRARVDRTVN